jgi:hypothetical protein
LEVNLSETEYESPPKFDLRAVKEREGITYDRICLCSEERHLGLIRGILEEGNREGGGYGELCKEFLSDLNQGYISEFVWELGLGPWPVALRDEIASESEPYLQVGYFFGAKERLSAWAWLWLPTFPENARVLTQVLKSLGAAWHRSPSLLDSLIAGRLPMPPGIEISTPTFFARHPYPTMSTENIAALPALKIEAIHGEAGAPEKFDWPKIREVSHKVAREGKPKSLKTLALKITAQLKEWGIRAPSPEYLRKRLPELLGGKPTGD